MKKVYLSLIVLCILLCQYASGQVQFQYEYPVGTSLSPTCNTLTNTASDITYDGNLYYIVGNDVGSCPPPLPGNHYGYIQAINKDGTSAWRNAMTSDATDLSFNGVTTGYNNDVIVAGEQANQFILMDVTNSGTLRMSSNYAPPFPVFLSYNHTNNDYKGGASSVIKVLDNNGQPDGYLAVGYYNSEAYVVKTDQDLEISGTGPYWQKMYWSANNNGSNAISVVEEPDNQHFLVLINTSSNIEVMELDYSGNTTTNRFSIAPTSGTLAGTRIQKLSGGGYIISGTMTVSSVKTAVLIPLNVSGSTISMGTSVQMPSSVKSITGIIVNSSGNIVVCGDENGNGFMAEFGNSISNASTMNFIYNPSSSNANFNNILQVDDDGYAMAGLGNIAGTVGNTYMVKTNSGGSSNCNFSQQAAFTPGTLSLNSNQVTYSSTINLSPNILSTTPQSETGINKICEVCTAPPTVIISDPNNSGATSSPLCPTGLITLQASNYKGASYEWWFNNGSGLTKINGATKRTLLVGGPNCTQTRDFTEQAGLTYTYTVKNLSYASSCVSSASATYVIKELPTSLTISSSSTSNCITDGSTITLSSSVSDNTLTYTWYKDYTVYSHNQSINIPGSDVSTASGFTLTISYNSSCSVSSNEIDIYKVSTPSLGGVFAGGSSANIPFLGTQDRYTYCTYTWYLNGAQISANPYNSDPSTYIINQPGTYTVVVNYNHGNYGSACTATSNTFTMPSVTGPTCFDHNLSASSQTPLSINSSMGNTFGVTWYNSSNLSTPLGTGWTYVPTQTGNYCAVLDFNYPNQCNFRTADYAVTVIPLTSIKDGSGSTSGYLSYGSSSGPTLHVDNGGSSNYAWYFIPQNSTTAQYLSTSNTISANSLGDYYAIVSNSSCSGPSSHYVLSQITTPTITCTAGNSCQVTANHNSTVSLSAGGSTPSGYTYKWYKNGNAYGTGTSVTADDIAQYSVQLVQNSSGAASPAAYFDIRDPNITLDQEVDNPQCVSGHSQVKVFEYINFTVGTGYGLGQNGYDAYTAYVPMKIEWHWGDNSSNTYTSSDVNSSNGHTHNYSASGGYQLYYVLTDAGGCTYMSSYFNITINASTVSIQVTDPGIVCSASTSNSDLYKRHKIHVHVTGLDDLGSQAYNVGQVKWSDNAAVYGYDASSYYFSSGTLDFYEYLEPYYYGYLTATVTNSGCSNASTTIQITSPASAGPNYYTPGATSILSLNVPGSPATYYAVRGATFNPISAINLSTYSNLCGYSFAPSSGTTPPSGFFNSSTYNINTAYAASGSPSYSFDMTVPACSTSSPPLACSSTGYTQTVKVFDPSYSVSYAPYCGGSTTTLTVTVTNLPEDFGFTPYLYDANNNPIDPSPSYYYNGYSMGFNKQFVLTYTVPTVTGNTMLDFKLQITHQYVIGTYTWDGGNITLTPKVSQGISLNYSIGGGSSSAVTSTPISVCQNDATTYPDIATTITGTVPTHSYQLAWYDLSNPAVPITSPLTITASGTSISAGNLSTGLFPGVTSYQLQVSDLTPGACTISTNVSLSYAGGSTTPTAPIASGAYYCSGSGFTLNAPGYTNYQWQELINGQWTSNFSNGSGSTTVSPIAIDHAGTYRYYTIPPVGCKEISDPITVTDVKNGLTIYDTRSTYTLSTSTLDISSSSSSYYSSPYSYYVLGSSTPIVTTSSSTWNPGGTPGLSAGYYYMTARDCNGNTVQSNYVYLSSGSCPSCGGSSPCLSNSTPTPQTGTLVNTSSDFDVNTPGLNIQIGATGSSRSTLTMGNCKKIIVEPGCMLTIENTDIIGCSPWEGIIVKSSTTTPPGILVMKNCTVSDAAVGVVSKDGGQMDIENCTFSNNGLHIEVLPYSSALSATIKNNTFNDVVPSTNACTPVYSYTNPSTPKMIYINGVNGFSNSIQGNTFNSAHPGINAVEIYSSNTIDFNGNTFSGGFAHGVYAFGNAGADVYNINFEGNTFDGSGSSGTFITGIMFNNVSGCGVTGSSSLNIFKYLANGIEYYNNSAYGVNNTIVHNKFTYSTYGFVGSPNQYPVNAISGANAYTGDLGISIKCNDFLYNNIGILGTGNLSTQGSAATDAGNNFNNISIPSSSCTGCPSRNTCADILWVGSSSGASNYYTSSTYDPYLNTSSSCSGIVLNGTSVTSSVNISFGSATNTALESSSLNTCWGTFKKGASVGDVTTIKPVIAVYPNPSNAQFTVEMKDYPAGYNYQLEVSDALGRRIMFENSGLTKQNINAETWTPGVYYLSITDSSGKMFSAQLLKLK